MPTRTRGPGAHHRQRRAEISDAVLAVVGEAGLGAVSLSTVAAHAGVSPGRVQHYFPTRDALLEAAFDHANDLAARRIDELAGPDPEPHRLLTVVLTELIPHDPTTRTHMRIRQFFAAQALIDRGIAERLDGQYAGLLDVVGGLLGTDPAVSSARGGSTETVRDIAVRIVALAEGLAYHVLTGRHDPATARRQVLAAVDELHVPTG